MFILRLLHTHTHTQVDTNTPLKVRTLCLYISPSFIPDDSSCQGQLESPIIFPWRIHQPYSPLEIVKRVDYPPWRIHEPYSPLWIVNRVDYPPCRIHQDYSPVRIVKRVDYPPLEDIPALGIVRGPIIPLEDLSSLPTILRLVKGVDYTPEGSASLALPPKASQESQTPPLRTHQPPPHPSLLHPPAFLWRLVSCGGPEERRLQQQPLLNNEQLPARGAEKAGAVVHF